MKNDVKDTHLKAFIRGGELTIKIGLETLSWAVDSENGGPLEYYKVGPTDEEKIRFGKDVVRAMTAENEVGETPLMLFLDRMAEQALEDGSGAVIKKHKT